MKGKIKAAVIGVGMIAREAHIPALLEAAAGDAALTALCDMRAEAAEQTARCFGIPHWYTDAEKMLEEIRPDLVCVCTPNSTHAAITRLALNHGAHVLCEKPLALSYAEGASLFALAKERGLTLTACQTQRFQRGILAAREYVREGLLGTLYYGEIERIRRRGIPAWGRFLSRENNGGGALADIGVHALDAMLWLLGNPRVLAVTGTAARTIISQPTTVRSCSQECGMLSQAPLSVTPDTRNSDVEDFACGAIRTETVPINFKIAWAAHLPNANRLTLLGDKMGLIAPEMKAFGALGQDQCDFSPRLFPLGPWDDKPFSGHYYLIRNVLDVLQGKAEALIQPEETLNTLAAIELFYRSAATGREALREEL